MNQQEIIQTTEKFVRETLAGAEGAHDWWHVYRVWQLSKHIAQAENVDSFVVELGALLHDIADSKFHNGDETVGPRVAREFLETQNVESEVVDHVEKIIANISFKNSLQGSTHDEKFQSLELAVVQDADRLDAIGAIGIARTFNFGGHKNLELYNPGIPPKPNMTKEEYKNKTAPSLNHFYEKLLGLKDKMNTETAKSLALGRHKFMEQYLEQFYNEWEGRA